MTKLQKDLESIKHPSIIRIANHLIANSNQDSLIRESIDKSNKSLEGMYAYVTSEARKHAQHGSAMIDDETVFNWAQHYYDEDSLDFEPKQNVEKGKDASKGKVKEIELPEEDVDVFDF